MTSDFGDLPEDWTVRTLAEVCLMRSGGTPPKSDPSLWMGSMPWVSGKDLKVPRLRDAIDHITPEAAEQYSKVAPAGSVLVLVRGMGLANGFALSLIERPMAFNQDLKALTPKDGLDSSFLMHALTYAGTRMLRNVADAAHGTKRLSQDDLDTFQLPVPPREEQRLIGEVLDRCRDAIDKEAAAEDVASRIRLAAVRLLFTRGVRDEDTKETDIGIMPSTWDALPFEAALTIAQGQVDPKVEPYASMLHIGPENVEPNTGRLLSCQTAKDLGLISGKYHFRAGDIIYSKIRPYLNKVVMPAFEGVCSADMYPLRAATGFESRFLFHYLLSEFFLRQAVPHQLRTGIPKINREQLADTAFPKPPLEDQRAIIEILDALDAKIELHRRKQSVLKGLLASLLQKLMTGEVRVDSLDLSALATSASSNTKVSA